MAGLNTRPQGLWRAGARCLPSCRNERSMLLSVSESIEGRADQSLDFGRMLDDLFQRIVVGGATV